MKEHVPEMPHKCMHLDCENPPTPHSKFCRDHRQKSSFDVDELTEQNEADRLNRLRALRRETT